MVNIILYSIVITVLARLLYYAIGEPSHNYNPMAIFGNYPYWLAKKVLQYYDIEADFLGQLKTIGCHPIHQLKTGFNEVKKAYLQRAFALFTYQNIIGICPICTFFWVSILFILLPLVLVFNTTILTAASIAAISNVTFKLLIKHV